MLSDGAASIIGLVPLALVIEEGLAILVLFAQDCDALSLPLVEQALAVFGKDTADCLLDGGDCEAGDFIACNQGILDRRPYAIVRGDTDDEESLDLFLLQDVGQALGSLGHVLPVGIRVHDDGIRGGGEL